MTLIMPVSPSPMSRRPTSSISSSSSCPISSVVVIIFHMRDHFHEVYGIDVLAQGDYVFVIRRHVFDDFIQPSGFQ